MTIRAAAVPDIHADAIQALGSITDEKSKQFAEGLHQAITSAVSSALTAVERLRTEDPSAFAELLKGLEATRT